MAPKREISTQAFFSQGNGIRPGDRNDIEPGCTRFFQDELLQPLLLVQVHFYEPFAWFDADYLFLCGTESDFSFLASLPRAGNRKRGDLRYGNEPLSWLF
jgi:hypothetical protein